MSFVVFRDHASRRCCPRRPTIWPVSAPRCLRRMRAAAGPTGGVVPAAADEVSALTAAQFAATPAVTRPSAPRPTPFTALLVSTLQTNATSYAATEAANAAAAG